MVTPKKMCSIDNLPTRGKQSICENVAIGQDTTGESATVHSGDYATKLNVAFVDTRIQTEGKGKLQREQRVQADITRRSNDKTTKRNDMQLVEPNKRRKNKRSELTRRECNTFLPLKHTNRQGEKSTRQIDMFLR